MTETGQRKIAVIGGGAAGMMAAGTACALGAAVTLYEHTDRLGKKLAITGKGRCNVTNACTAAEFLANVPHNPRFLYAALSAFSPEDTVAHFERLGVKLKVERGNRVFPESDRARDIVLAMTEYAGGAKKRFENVRAVHPREDGTFTVTATGEEIYDAVILATGGRSYPLTGSDGSGYRIARKLGHTVTPLSPSLVPLESPDPLCAELQGLSLKNVGIRITDGGRTVYEDFGEMLFTHFGVSGPTVLSASSHLVGRDLSSLTFHIDLKPALDEVTLDARLLSDFSERNNKDFSHALDALLPAKLKEPLIRLTGIDPRKKVNAVTREERHRVLSLLKDFSFPLSGFRPIEEAIITSGGVDVREVVPGTMESKLHPGLYFAGEILDVDAYTGGFNLQIAFSTGYLAGTHAALPY
ncbi:MAG TPA: aminoacetone oxidase family FAD-binding enzyme [Clostridiales bacterium]|nr:aminoacetone oxidase family FAD-binding enzyme [Clostridiales bacterium]